MILDIVETTAKLQSGVYIKFCAHILRRHDDYFIFIDADGYDNDTAFFRLQPFSEVSRMLFNHIDTMFAIQSNITFHVRIQGAYYVIKSDTIDMVNRLDTEKMYNLYRSL